MFQTQTVDTERIQRSLGNIDIDESIALDLTEIADAF